MDYSATSEWLCEHIMILRVHEGLDAKYGDPYIWSVTVVKEGDDALMKGVMEAPPHSATKAICDFLRDLGFKRRVHERIKGGQTIKIAKRL